MTLTVLWELRHRTADKTVCCAYRHAHPAAHFVAVTVGQTERFREQHGTEAEAYDEAAYLLDHFLLQGWTQVAYCDPRVNSPLINPPLEKPRSTLGRHHT